MIRLGRIIRKNEAWLYRDKVALKAMQHGLADARAARIIKGPDLAALVRFIKKLSETGK